MVQSHNDDWLYILLCDLQLWAKKFYYLIHVHCVISRDLAHHELTQDKFDCRLVDCIAVTQRLQPCPHIINRMDTTIKDLLLQWLCHLTIVDFLHTSANRTSSFALGLASVH